MCIIGAYVIAGITPHTLEARPDVGLDIFDHMAQMDRTICIGQGRCDQNLARHVRKCVTDFMKGRISYLKAVVGCRYCESVDILFLILKLHFNHLNREWIK